MTRLEGTFTALITPFLSDGNVDFEAFEKIMQFQISQGIDGVVVGGSTGENFALSATEKEQMIKKAIEISAGRIKIIAGTGTNDTATSCRNTRAAFDLHADAALVVAPFYNKPVQRALVEHYGKVADSAPEMPIIIYNVPGRTSVNILPETIVTIARKFENVIAVKEASGNVEQMMAIIKDAPEKFSLLSGDDSLTFPVVAAGGRGVISTISNYLPGDFTKMTHLALEGKINEARELHYKYFDLMNLNFIETNPGPVKYVMSKLGLCNEVYRLPMTSLTDEHKTVINKELTKCGVLAETL